MGLDMYLTRRIYVQNWSFQNEDEKHTIIVKKGGKVRTDIDPSRIAYIEEAVAYWRKANAIHRWFVENVQGGVDDCKRYYVSRKQLKQLVDVCKEVLNSVNKGTKKLGTVAQKQIAEKILPTASGFFFGSTDYDQSYLNDLRYTVKTIEPLLDEKEGDYEYHSSW